MALDRAMKKLEVVIKNGNPIVEYHGSSVAAMTRLAELCMKHDVISSCTSDVIKHLELKGEPVITSETYGKIKDTQD